MAPVTSAQAVSFLNVLTTKSQVLQGPAQSITIVNGPLIIVGLGPFPQVIAGLVDFVSTATSSISQIQGTPPFAAGADSDSVHNAFRDFGSVHQVLLNMLIGKAGVFQTNPTIGQPVAAVLRQVESVVDTLGIMLAETAKSRASDIQTMANSVGETLGNAIKAYDGISSI